MPEKFLAIENYDLKKGQELIALKKGESYSRKDLVKFLEKEGTLNFKLKCTKLKNALIEFDKDIQESIRSDIAQEPVAQEPVAQEPVAQEPVAQEPVAQEPVAQEPVAQEMVFLVNKQIKKDNKVLFKKGQKIAISELKDLDVASLVADGSLIETKIAKETANKE